MRDETPLAETNPSVSLLWPPGSDSSTLGRPLDDDAVNDLDLKKLIAAFYRQREHRQHIGRILLHLCHDPEVINYRQAVVEDLITHPQLLDCLEDILPTIDQVLNVRVQATSSQKLEGLYEVSWRLSELEAYVDCVQKLGQAFCSVKGKLNSAGLLNLQTLITNMEKEPSFQRLVQELPDLLSNIRSIASITIGVNLDAQLRPIEATLLAVNQERFKSPSSLLNKLLGKEHQWLGIAQLHSAPQRTTHGALLDPDTHGYKVDPILIPLFRDLAQVSKQVSRPLAQALKEYTRLNSRIFVELGPELAFFIGAVKLIQSVQAAGLPMCKPELAPAGERSCHVENYYNLNLALHLILTTNGQRLDEKIVTNYVDLGTKGRIAILTGPNQGGKTTFTQGIGLVQVLAQAGLYVPGSKARISPAEMIYTHFPIEERPDRGTGRFGDEAKRLYQILTQATSQSLILLNESLSSTSAGESLYLARDIVRVMQLMGVRAIYSTHLHDLADSIEQLNSETEGDGRVISLVASLVSDNKNLSDEVRRSFKIVPSPPMGYSCAREIAQHYGISYEQLVDNLYQRGIVDQPVEDA